MNSEYDRGFRDGLKAGHAMHSTWVPTLFPLFFPKKAEKMLKDVGLTFYKPESDNG